MWRASGWLSAFVRSAPNDTLEMLEKQIEKIRRQTERRSRQTGELRVIGKWASERDIANWYGNRSGDSTKRLKPIEGDETWRPGRHTESTQNAMERIEIKTGRSGCGRAGGRVRLVLILAVATYTSWVDCSSLISHTRLAQQTSRASNSSAIGSTS